MTQASTPPLQLVQPSAHVLVLGELKGVIPKSMSIRLASQATGSIVLCQKVEEPLTTGRAIKEIKAITGLPWDRVAGIFNRQVRTVHFWAEGQGTDADTEEFILRVHAILCRAGKISPLRNRLFLLSVVRDGETVLDRLRKKEFKEVGQYLDRHLADALPIAQPTSGNAAPGAGLPSPAVLMTANPDIGSSIKERVVRSKAKPLSGV